MADLQQFAKVAGWLFLLGLATIIVGVVMEQVKKAALSSANLPA